MDSAKAIGWPAPELNRSGSTWQSRSGSKCAGFYSNTDNGRYRFRRTIVGAVVTDWEHTHEKNSIGTAELLPMAVIVDRN